MVEITFISSATNCLKNIPIIQKKIEDQNIKYKWYLTPNAKKLANKENINIKYHNELEYITNTKYIFLYPTSVNTLHKLYYKIYDNFAISRIAYFNPNKIYIFVTADKYISKQIIPDVYKTFKHIFLGINNCLIDKIEHKISILFKNDHI